MGLIARLWGPSKTEAKPELKSPSKGVFGTLLERAGSWVKPIGRAKYNAEPLKDKPEWQDVKNLDLSECNFLPSGFTTPAQLEQLRVKYDANEQGGILKESVLQEGIRENDRPVKVEFVISTREIFGIMQDSPENLSAAMANIIVGKRDGVKGLSDRALFRALV
jgi:hypothetical protein